MKFHLLAVVSGLMLVSGSAFGQVPTADTPGTMQAATETGKTSSNILESSTQVQQYQKTMSKVGTSVSTVSGYATNMQKKMMEYTQKVQDYQNQIKDYQAKMQAYKADIMEAYDIAKDPGALAKNFANQVKGAATGMVSGVVDTVKDTANSAIDTAKSAKDTAMSAKDSVADVAGDVAGQAGTSAEAEDREDLSVDAADEATISGGNNTASGTADLVDMPVARPTRTVIGSNGGTSSGIASGSNGAVAVSGGAVANVAAGVSAGAVSVGGGSVISGAAVPSAVPSAVSAPISAQPQVSASVSRAVDLSDAVELNAQPLAAATADVMETAKEKAVLSEPLAKADLIQSSSEMIEQETVAKPEAEQLKTMDKVQMLKQKAQPIARRDAVTELKASRTNEQLKIKEGLAKSDVKLDSSAEKLNKSGAVKELKTLRDVKQNLQPTKTNVSKPRRAIFKTSAGYGHLRSSWPLAFAQIGGMKTGETEDKVLIVPESLGLYCNLNYEQAAAKGAMDKCLKKVNKVRYSKQDDKLSREDIDNARKDIQNGLVEYMTAAFFEALDVYNESLTFKDKQVDPLLKHSAEDIDGAWVYAKEMNQLLGTRINVLNKLWSRHLGIKVYSLYDSFSLQASEEDSQGS